MMRIPAAPTIPNMTIVAPPSTGLGNERQKPPTAGNKPIKTRRPATSPSMGSPETTDVAVRSPVDSMVVMT